MHHASAIRIACRCWHKHHQNQTTQEPTRTRKEETKLSTPDVHPHAITSQPFGCRFRAYRISAITPVSFGHEGSRIPDTDADSLRRNHRPTGASAFCLPAEIPYRIEHSFANFLSPSRRLCLSKTPCTGCPACLFIYFVCLHILSAFT